MSAKEEIELLNKIIKTQESRISEQEKTSSSQKDTETAGEKKTISVKAHTRERKP